MKVRFSLLIAFFLFSFGGALLASSPAPAAEELQTVIIVLKEQPQVEIAQQVWKEKQAQFQRERVDLLKTQPLSEWRRQNLLPLTRQEENALVHQFAQQSLDEATLRLLAQKAAQLEATRQAARQEIYRRSLPRLQKSQAGLVRQIEAWGGEVVYQYTLWNALAARIPAERLPELEALEQVDAVFEDGVLEALLDVSGPSIGAPAFWNAGYNGQGVDVAVVDTGIDANHPALAGKVLAQRSCAPGDSNPDDLHGHGTHVGGILASQDATYRGIAYGLRALINAKASSLGSMTDTDAMACIEWAVLGNPYGAEVINFSFGGSTANDDTPLARFFDAVVSQMNVVVTAAAGNSGPNPQTLVSPSIAPNVMSVANVQDFGTINRSDDEIRPSSSRGPTGGGRKKPDLAAPGTNILSAENDWEGPNSDWIALTGTSMAAPHVAGAAALLISRGVSDALAVKAVLINTAEDYGAAGWDNAYGWGYIDLTNALFHAEDVFVSSVAEAPAVRFFAGPVLSGDHATLVWNRRVPYVGANYPPAPNTLSDLNLFAYREADNTLLGTSASTIDNVEQFVFSANESEAVLAVRATGDIVGASEEPFALAVPEGFTPRFGPYLSILANLGGDLQGQAGEVISVTVMVKNSGDLKAFNNTLTLTASENLSLLSSTPLSQSLPDLAVGETYPITVSWLFQKQNDENATLQLTANSYSYGSNFPSFSFIPIYNYYFPLFFR